VSIQHFTAAVWNKLIIYTHHVFVSRDFELGKVSVQFANAFAITIPFARWRAAFWGVDRQPRMGLVFIYIGIRSKFRFNTHTHTLLYCNCFMMVMLMMMMMMVWNAGVSGGRQPVHSDHFQRERSVELHSQWLWQHRPGHHSHPHSLGTLAAGSSELNSCLINCKYVSK